MGNLYSDACLTQKECFQPENRPPWESTELQLDPDTVFIYWINFKFAASQARRPDVVVSPDLPNSPIAAQIITLFFFPKETWSQFCGLANASAWFCHNSQGTHAPVNAYCVLPCQEDDVLHYDLSFLFQCLPSWGFFCRSCYLCNKIILADVENGMKLSWLTWHFILECFEKLSQNCSGSSSHKLNEQWVWLIAEGLFFNPWAKCKLENLGNSPGIALDSQPCHWDHGSGVTHMALLEYKLF